ncbi:MAG TPA: adenylyl-sulfate kinase [Chthonomonadaceae bacterium]|nr:adenylyl-sulfate kinase [Chthonomonadaceae bacterium]
MGSHQGFILWFTGLSGAGKSTLAERLVQEFKARNYKVELLDGDEIRTHLSKGLGFSKEDRDTNIRRIGWVARVLARNGVIAITAAISPYREIRDEIRADTDKEGRTTFVEVYANAPVEALIDRDVKGLYKKALSGEIKQFTGISDPYEAPEKPEITVHTSTETVDESLRRILGYLSARGLIDPS